MYQDNNDSNIRNLRNKSFELPLSILCKWLKMIWEKTKDHNIENAFRTIQFLPLTPDERDIVVTVKQLYIAEMNGDLNPPPSMREIYENIEAYYE